ncbi:hypothetical protein, partial [Nocardia cyriacigeorgica]|uniref:hypothetical protein n=1 Tax=Nocardia cyriacigeorgica TaxID=135487 RepID=UPI0024577512
MAPESRYTNGFPSRTVLFWIGKSARARRTATGRTAQLLGAIGISVEREAARLEHQRLLAAAREEAIQRLT